MSNNKLYTESEVRKAIELSRDTHQEGRPYMERDEYDYSIDEVVDLLTPIELPSDEEILKNAIKPLHGLMDEWDKGFLFGAKWMHFKIQGGNNEQQ